MPAWPKGNPFAKALSGYDGLLQEKTLFIPLLGPLGLQVPCKKLVFSLKDPDTFLANFNQGRPEVNGAPKNVVIE